MCGEVEEAPLGSGAKKNSKTTEEKVTYNCVVQLSHADEVL